MKSTIALACMAVFAAAEVDTSTLESVMLKSANDMKERSHLVEKLDTSTGSVFEELVKTLKEMSAELVEIKTKNEKELEELRTKNERQDNIIGALKELYLDINSQQVLEDHFWTNEDGYNVELNKCFDPVTIKAGQSAEFIANAAPPAHNRNWNQYSPNPA